ncbi:hypothetical protein P3560_24255, partial [Vibrio parahaemolyticus]|nr:hypothetical protein [Vibrio parahaemolyticus]
MFKKLLSSPSVRNFALWVRTFLMLTPSVSPASSLTKTDDLEPRPKVAVVLAGGGAKGAAHIGVLKALEEMQI